LSCNIKWDKVNNLIYLLSAVNLGGDAFVATLSFENPILALTPLCHYAHAIDHPQKWSAR